MSDHNAMRAALIELQSRNVDYLHADDRAMIVAALEPAPRPLTYAELIQRHSDLCAAAPDYGTPAYRGDPADAVAALQEAHRQLNAAARRIVDREVRYCVSALVSTLATKEWPSGSMVDNEDLYALASRAPNVDDYADQCEQVGGKPIITVTEVDGAWDWTWSDGSGDDGGTGFDTELEAWQDAFECTRQDTPDGSEVYEHWTVSNWLADQLRTRGETVRDDVAGLTIWGRCTTGQAIYMDSVLQDVARGMLLA